MSGNILSGSGLGGDYGVAVPADGKNKNLQVDEITVDDIMSMLIVAQPNLPFSPLPRLGPVV
jgi:hypothetical protein